MCCIVIGFLIFSNPTASASYILAISTIHLPTFLTESSVTLSALVNDEVNLYKFEEALKLW